MHAYRITIEAIAPLSEDAKLTRLQLNVMNHDDLFKIIEAVQSKNFLAAHKTAALAIGLKLFLEETLKRRQDTLFAPIIEPLEQFIREPKVVPIDTQASILEEGRK